MANINLCSRCGSVFALGLEACPDCRSPVQYQNQTGRTSTDLSVEGERLLRNGEYAAAVEALTDALRANPNHQRVYELRASAYSYLRQYELAENDRKISEKISNSGRIIPSRKEENLENPHVRRMLIGLLLVVGGGFLTLVTYNAAAPGGTYFVFWGAMIWGGIIILRGVLGWLSGKN